VDGEEQRDSGDDTESPPVPDDPRPHRGE
jgi:hypothetical protein